MIENIMINKVDNGYIVQIEPLSHGIADIFSSRAPSVPTRYVFSTAEDLANFIHCWFGAMEDEEEEKERAKAPIVIGTPHSDSSSVGSTTYWKGFVRKKKR